MSVNYRTASRRVRAFMETCHEQALDILVQYYQEDDKTRDKIEALLEHAESNEQHAIPGHQPSNKQSEFATSPSESHHYDSPVLSGKRPTHRYSSSSGGPNPPFTPPRTASSVKSQGSKSGHATSKYIIITSGIDGVIDEEKVRYEVASVPYSLIRKEVVDKPGFMESLVDAELDSVPVPSRVTAIGYTNVFVDDAVNLTWFHPGAKRTRRTIFYIIADDSLELDVILSASDIEKPNPDFMTKLNTHHVRHAEPDDYVMSSPTPDPRAESYHKSAYSSQRPANPISRRDGSDQRHQQYAQEVAEAVMGEGQAQYNKRKETHQPTTRTDPDSSYGSYETARTSRSAPYSSARQAHSESAGAATDPNSAGSRIRLKIDCGGPPIMIWLDMCAPGGAFFQDVQKVVGKKHPFERMETTLFLKQDKQSSDDNEYALPLGEDELDADWETTLDWIMENKKEKPPHIYGRVDFGNG